MSQKEDLIAILEKSRSKMMAQLVKIDLQPDIYPLWTIREMLAHLSGWDAAVIDLMRAVLAGQTPATLAAHGIDVYNAESIAARESLDYDQVYREYIEVRKTLIELLRQFPDESLSKEYVLPWGEPGTMLDIVNIWGPHEEEHADDLKKITSQDQGQG